MAFYNTLTCCLACIGRWASVVRQGLFTQGMVLIVCLLGASVCQGFTVFNPTDSDYALTFKDSHGKNIASVKVTSHVPQKVPGFEGQAYDSLGVTFQQESSWFQSLVQPFSFLWGGAAASLVPQTTQLKPARWEHRKAITRASNLMLTDAGPRLVGPLLGKALVPKAYAIKRANINTKLNRALLQL